MAATHEDRNAQLSPGVAIKTPCRTATTGAITLSAEQSIDGVACVTGDRVLVKDQADQTTNGIYGCSTGSWTREPDFDGNRDVVKGTFVFITNGATNAGAFYECTTVNPVVFGSSNITFAQGALGPIAIPLPATNVTFTPSGAGAVARTVQDKLREIKTSGDNPTIGVSNIFIATGDTAITSGVRNIAIGGADTVAPAGAALAANTTGSSNIAIGPGALKSNTTGSSLAIGEGALRAQTTGTENMGIGGGSGSSITTGNTNVIVGGGSGGFISTGNNNVTLGVDSLHGTVGSEITGSDNTAIGTSSLQAAITTAGSNTAVGAGAGILLTTGGSNVLLGAHAAASLTTESNALYVDNQSRGSAALDKAGAIFYGKFSATPANQTLQTNAVATNPQQPAFLVNATTTANATGDGTQVNPVLWGTEVYDQHADFAANTFTAPVAGRYHFDVNLNLTNLGAGHTSLIIQLIATSRTTTHIAMNPVPILLGGALTISGATDVDMAAGDTATIKLIVSNSTKTVGYDTSSKWSGHLVC